MAVDHEKLKSIFLEAIDRPSSDLRAAYLDEACGTDLPLRQRVEDLLKARDRAQNGARQQEPTRAESGEPPKEGDEHFSVDPAARRAHTGAYTGKHPISQIVDGRYKVLELINEGGMGSVFLADELEPVRRKVALKVIKPGMDSSQVIARFEAERQALAMMDHPNIAKVFHGGVTEQGRPYFVMEYVQGLPLTEFCDEHRLTVPQRLELFLQICDAIQHAHQKGIVHRDLKPSNILVGLVNDKPIPKVIDFGLAKALYQPITEHSYHTARDMVVGTAQYMSPEQAGFHRLDIDTRTDIYSLGVVLYELLTGTTPLEKRRVKEAMWEEVARLIREEEPEKPSTKLSHSDQLPSVAALRRSEPFKLSRQLRGDLDWIVMKALHKDRKDRYPTANAFAEDVQHFLKDEPVSAGPPTLRYRLGKYLRKHRGKVAVAAALLLLLVTGTITTAWGWAHAVRETKRANEAVANYQAQLEFLCNDILNQVDPGEQIKPNREFEKNIKLIDVLGRAAERVGERFVHQPLVEASLRFTIGKTYYSLGDFHKARLHLERAEALRAEHLGEKNSLRLDTLDELGWTYAALDLSELAETTFRRVLALRQETLGIHDVKTLKSQYALVVWDVYHGNLEQADKRLEHLLRDQKQVLPAFHPDILSSQRCLADVLKGQKKYDNAENLYAQTLDEMRTALGRDHPETLTTWNNLGLLSLDRGEALVENGEKENARAAFLKAETLFLELTEVSKNVRGLNHANHLKAMQNLAAAYTYLEKFADALVINQRVLEQHEALLGPNHVDTIAILMGRASILANSGQSNQAEPILLEAWKRIDKQPIPRDKHELMFDTTISLYGLMGNPEKVRQWQVKKAAWSKSKPL